MMPIYSVHIEWDEDSIEAKDEDEVKQYLRDSIDDILFDAEITETGGS